MDSESVIGNYKTFLDKIFQNLEKAGFAVEEFMELDHIAYRTENNESYEKIKNELLDLCSSFSEVFFGGRLILVGRLKEPLIYESFRIKGIELLAPKENNTFKEGLEHAEFVIKSALQEFREKHAEINFNLDAYERKENPELIVKFGDCAVKFHTQSLLEIRNI